MSEKILFERHFRTPYSEGYYIYTGNVAADSRIGNIDIHFTMTTVHGTLILEKELPQDELDRIMQQIDEELVLSSDMPREDFLISLYTGKDHGFYSDDYFAQKAMNKEDEIEDISIM